MFVTHAWCRYEAGQNRFITCFVYLNTVKRGGATCWTHIGCHKGKNGTSFYDEPAPLNTLAESFSWKADQYKTVAVQPKRGLAVVHFPCMLPEYGGRGDGNAFHMAESAIDEKFIMQQFIYSSPRWQVGERDRPAGRLSSSVC